jgi:plastocyanin
MLQKLSMLNGIYLVTSTIFLVINAELSMSEATDSQANNETESTNMTSNETRSTPNKNTIILNVVEVGDEEQYRWVDVSGAENPTINIMMGKNYTFKVSNRTPEVHELIIDTKVNGKVSEIAKSDEIQQYSKNVEFKFKSDKAGSLEYHCKYHPGMMNGTIIVAK